MASVEAKKQIEKRFVDHDTLVEDYVESLENKNAKRENGTRCEMLEQILRNEDSHEREVRNIDHAELHKHLEHFIRSVRRKDGEDNKPSSLSLTTTNNNLNLSMYMIIIIQHGKCFVQYLRKYRNFCLHFPRSILYILDQQLHNAMTQLYHGKKTKR